MKKKSYKIVATTTYNGVWRTYTEKSGFNTKKAATDYMKKYCYTTVTRTFHVEEE